MSRSPESQLAADLGMVAANAAQEGYVLARTVQAPLGPGATSFTLVHKNGGRYQVGIQEVVLVEDLAVGEVKEHPILGTVRRIPGETETEAGKFVACTADDVPCYLPHGLVLPA